MPGLMGNIQGFVDQAAQVDPNKQVNTKNYGMGTKTVSVNTSGGGVGLGSTTSTFDISNKGSAWNTGLDADVGKADKTIGALSARQAAGDSSFKQSDLDAATAQRQKLNTARWRSANISGSPNKDALAGMIKSGQISYDDLGKIDITTLNDDAKLGDAIKSIADAKKVVAAPPTPAAPDPAIAAAEGAQKAVDQSIAGIQTGAQNIMANAMNPFDKSVSEAGASIESNSNALAHSLGGAGAGAAAAQAGAGLEANATAQKAVVEGNAKSDIQKFIDKQLVSATGSEADLAGMDTAHKVDVQRQGLEALKTEISKNVDMSDSHAKDQMQQLSAAIDDWNAAVKRGEEGTAEHNKILGIAGGLAMAGIAGAGIYFSGGTLTPFLAPVAAAGVVSAANSARS
jgi:hypothetical protein